MITVRHEGTVLVETPKKFINSAKRAYRTSETLSVFKPGESLTSFEIKERLKEKGGEYFNYRNAIFNMRKDGVLVLEVIIGKYGRIFKYRVSNV